MDLDHTLYWVNQTGKYYTSLGFSVIFEYAVKGNGSVDILAEKDGHKIIIEVETGKSDTLKNLQNACKAKPDKLVFVATNPQAVSVCKKVINSGIKVMKIELLTWIDIY